MKAKSALIFEIDDFPLNPDNGIFINLIFKFSAIFFSGPLEVPIHTTSVSSERNFSAITFAGYTCPPVPPERI